MKILIGLMVLWNLNLNSSPDFTKSVREEKTIKLDDPNVTVVIENLYGNIKVKPGNSKEATFVINKEFTAYDEGKANAAMEEVSVGWIERNDSIIAFVKAPYICDKWNGCHQNGRWIRKKTKYEFLFDFEITIPKEASIIARTVDQGKIDISDIEGTVVAQNVNGPVKVSGAKKLKNASTVSGDVNVSYLTVPVTDARFNTVSGKIEVYCSAKLNAKVYTKSMHGDLFTSFDFVTLPRTLEKSTEYRHGSTRYKIGSRSGIEIGKNGPTLSMETLSGDIFLRKL